MMGDVGNLVNLISNTSISYWKLMGQIIALYEFRLLLLCHKPNLLFRPVFDNQQLIERFKNNPKLSIRRNVGGRW